MVAGADRPDCASEYAQTRFVTDRSMKIDAQLAWARREDAIARQRETARDAAAEARLALARATRYQELVNGDLTPFVRQLEAITDAAEEEH